jgi:hypothetical protein
VKIQYLEAKLSMPQLWACSLAAHLVHSKLDTLLDCVADHGRTLGGRSSHRDRLLGTGRRCPP